MLNIKEIEQILKDNLQGKHYEVREGRTFCGGRTLEIVIARNNIAINGVKGQYSEVVSFWIREEDNKLAFQIFGGNGGRGIYREIDKSEPSERYYALQSEYLPAIRIKDNARAITKICKDYMAITKSIAERGLTH